MAINNDSIKTDLMTFFRRNCDPKRSKKKINCTRNKMASEKEATTVNRKLHENYFRIKCHRSFEKLHSFYC